MAIRLSMKNVFLLCILIQSSYGRPITLHDSIKEFLQQTDELESETERMMSLPRCGIQDAVRDGDKIRRYVLLGSKWPSKDLTYNITRYPSKQMLSIGDVDAEIAKAFNMWAVHTDLTFTKKSSSSFHIDIRFAKRDHGDGNPFDGPEGTLAHAFHPNAGGSVHFDDEENWSNSYLMRVAVHEFGHSLGLDHSDIESAVMFPFLNDKEHVTLHQDDILAIQELYGPKSICNNDYIDAIWTDENNITTFVFKGKNDCILTQESFPNGYPREISKDGPGLPAI